MGNHELAHVRRRDDWTNLVQHCINALFFFHPAIWWVSKRISLEREIACDDQVLHSTRRPRAYALLLADLATRMFVRPKAIITRTTAGPQGASTNSLNSNYPSMPAKSKLSSISTRATVPAGLGAKSASNSMAESMERHSRFRRRMETSGAPVNPNRNFGLAFQYRKS